MPPPQFATCRLGTLSGRNECDQTTIHIMNRPNRIKDGFANIRVVNILDLMALHLGNANDLLLILNVHRRDDNAAGSNMRVDIIQRLLHIRGVVVPPPDYDTVLQARGNVQLALQHETHIPRPQPRSARVLLAFRLQTSLKDLLVHVWPLEIPHGLAGTSRPDLSHAHCRENDMLVRINNGKIACHRASAAHELQVRFRRIKW
mmetsp:Transcript_11469/g.32221  ORF Transcript_11469/g.32221 Transcript_11469/m.32221 type:complete len:203 (-) Transcript_11469:587-1195(-)